MTVVKKSGIVSRILVSSFSLALALGFMTPVASQAVTVESLVNVPETITATKSHTFIGDSENPTIKGVVSSQGVTANTDYTYVSMFDMDTGEYMGGCEGDRTSTLNCEVSLNGTTVNAVLDGVHNYQFVAEYFPEWQGLRSTPNSLSDIPKASAKSPVIPFERKPLALRLETGASAYFTNLSADDLNSYLNQKLNGEDSYRIYVFDITDDRLLGTSGAQSDWTFGTNPEYNFGNPHYYQSFLAKKPLDGFGGEIEVTSLNDLTEIVTSSNIVSLTRNKWETKIIPDPDIIEVETTAGGGSYGTYLVDDATGNIMADDTGFNSIRINNPYGVSATEQATSYVAQKWAEADGGNGVKPTNRSQLIDIQATSRKWVKSPGSGTISKAEVAGGTNPSEECAQGCQGDPVNMGTGEFFETKADLITAGNGLKATASRSFSTTNKDVLSPLGYGWNPNAKLSISSVNAVNPLANDTVINVNQENGSIVSFYKNFAGNYETGLKSQATLTRDSATGKFTFIRDRQNTFVFDSAGKLLSQKDIFDNSLSYTYTGNNIATVADNHGNTLTYAYNGSGFISTITDQNGQSVVYTYDLTKKLLTSVKDSTGVTFNYTYDTSRRVKTLSNALGGVTTNTYDSSHRVTQQVDPLNRILKFAYTGAPLNQSVIITQPDLSKSQEVYENGQLKERTLDYGTTGARKWKYFYGATNQVISTINPDNSTASAMYDDFGNLTKTIDGKGNVTTFTYNDLNKVLTAKNALGATTTNTYDAKGNLLTSTDPLGNLTSFAYNPDGTLLKATDARGNKSGVNPDDYSSTFGYNTKGILTQTIDSKGNKSTIGLDSLGRVTSSTNPLGNITGANTADYTVTTAYNALNLPSKVTNPLQGETNLTYDNMGNVLTSKDALNNVTTYTYDVLGNMLTVKNALNQTIIYTYDSMNRVSTITDANNKVSTITYDTSGRVKETKDPLNRITKQEWNSVDQLKATVDADNKRTEYTYDAAGNVLTSKDANGSVTSFLYDSLNRVSQVKDAEGRVLKKEYDSNGRLVKTTNADGTFETVGYDAVGNVTSTTNGAGKTQTWIYDSLNRKVSYTNEINQATSYTYDAASQLKQETRSDNSVVIYSYGKTGLLDSVDYPGTDADIIYTYDALGRSLTEKKGTSPESTYAYDAIGQLTSRGPPNQKVSYTYGVTGNTDSITYPSGRVVNYTYDDASQIASLQTINVGSIGFGYNNRGLATSVTLPTGVTESRSFDNVGRLTEKDIKNGSTSLYKKSQAYTATGNISQQTVTNPSSGSSVPKLEDFVYDPMSRITAQKNNADGSTVNGYNYNNVGNLTGNNSVTQNYDDSGKILTAGTNTFGYDTRNNRVSLIDSADANKNQTLTWNVDDTLTSVTKKVNGVNKTFGYSYDANGLLEKKTVAGSQSNSFVWDTSSSIPLMLSDGEHEYIYGNDRVPVAQVKISDGTVTYLHTDLNGSVTASTNGSGAIAGTVAYSPYGKATTAPISKFGYAGDWTDPDTSFTYLRNRWLDTTTGTFLSEDPMVQATGNSFGYTNGNPLTQIDPLGLFSINPLDWVESQVISPIKQKTDESFRHLTNSISQITTTLGNSAINAGSWVMSNSGSISAGLAVAAMATTATGVGAPVGAFLAGASVAFGLIGLVYEGAKCVGWVDGKSCDPAQLALAGISVVTGGVASLFKGVPLVARNLLKLDNLSFTATMGGLPATFITESFYSCTAEAKNKATNKMLDEYEKNREK
jgi:RHS repeat-associated protein